MHPVYHRDAEEGTWRGIAAIPDSDEFLVVDLEESGYFGSKILKCSSKRIDDCTVWLHYEQLKDNRNIVSPEFEYGGFKPYSITIFNDIVYVADESHDRTMAFSLSAQPLDLQLELAIGDYRMPYQLFVRPGTFAPLSRIESASEITVTAGETLSLPLDLRDSKNGEITSSFPEPSRFTTYATGEVDVGGVTVPVTFPQEVSTNENNEFFATASITSPRKFELHVKEGTSGIQNSFSNSPIIIIITHAATVPHNTVIESVNDGDNRIFTFTTYDEFLNPTNEEQKLRFYIGVDEESEHSTTNTVKIKRTRFFSGEETLFVTFEGVEIKRIDISLVGIDSSIFVSIVFVVVLIIAFLVRRAQVESKKRAKIYVEKEIAELEAELEKEKLLRQVKLRSGF